MCMLLQVVLLFAISVVRYRLRVICYNGCQHNYVLLWVRCCRIGYVLDARPVVLCVLLRYVLLAAMCIAHYVLPSVMCYLLSIARYAHVLL